LLALLLVASCTRERSPPAATPTSIRSELLRCTFDGAPDDVPQRELEAMLRRAWQRDRNEFAVRAGRCESVLTDAAREHDERVARLDAAWEELLPLLQSATPDPIQFEQAVRHVGNAWQALR
jgi:hypothetical protein